MHAKKNTELWNGLTKALIFKACFMPPNLTPYCLQICPGIISMGSQIKDSTHLL